MGLPAPSIRFQQEQYVVKSNEIIRTKKQHLTLQQTRILYFSISKIRPNDDSDHVYKTSVNEICTVCGLDNVNGYYYNSIKDDFLRLTSTEWLKIGNGQIRTIAWLKNVIINEKSGEISFQFDDFVQDHLFDLRSDYTQYQLQEVLVFQSKYAVRLYEFLKSYLWGNEGKHYKDMEEVIFSFDVEHLKGVMDATVYEKFTAFRTRALEKAVAEINRASTDMSIVSVSYGKTGKKTTDVTLVVQKKFGEQLRQSQEEAEKILNRYI